VVNVTEFIRNVAIGKDTFVLYWTHFHIAIVIGRHGYIKVYGMIDATAATGITFVGSLLFFSCLTPGHR
jgi:hypothetical protein